MALDVLDPGTWGSGPDAPSDDDLATCVHCGLCLNHCPTFRVTGNETESPRGRIYLMTQWKRGQLPFTNQLAAHIDLCLGCRTCEAVCPSGVPYGRIIEHGRAEVERVRAASVTRPKLARDVARVAMRTLLPHERTLRTVGRFTRASQRLGLTNLVAQGRQLPRFQGAPWRPPASGLAPARGPRRLRVAFLNGCAMPVMFRGSMEASVRLLQLAGADVWFPPAQTCCGALFAHNGDLDAARRLRDRNQAAFGMEDFDFLVTNSAGCGSHLKDFYENLGSRVRDLSELLAEVGLPEPTREVNLRVTYQDACHLVHAQRIRKQPRDLIRAVPGVQFVEMQHPDICCGSAGIYNALEPDMSQRILDEKMDDLLGCAADLVVTANPGCQMQLEAGVRGRRARLPVKHLAELLVQAYE